MDLPWAEQKGPKILIALSRFRRPRESGVTRVSASKKVRESQSTWLRKRRLDTSVIPALVSTCARVPSVGCLNTSVMTWLRVAGPALGSPAIAAAAAAVAAAAETALVLAMMPQVRWQKPQLQ